MTYLWSRQVNILILNGHEEKQTLLQIVFLDSPKSENYITRDTNKDIDVNRSRQADISKLQILISIYLELTSMVECASRHFTTNTCPSSAAM